MASSDPPPEDLSRSSFPRRRSRGSRGSRASRVRLADVRAGEGRLVLGAMVTLGGIVAGHVALETARDALFLTSMPAHGLGLVYLVMAVLGFVVSRYERTVARALGRTSALILALMGTGLGTFLFFMMERSRQTSFALYLWTGVVGTVVTVQFWLFLGARLSGAQARRLYGLIAAGGVVGAVCGGLASQLMTSFFPVETLLLVAAAAQLATALVLTWAPSPATVNEGKKPITAGEARELIHQSPYLQRVALLIAMATATLLVTDYIFKSATAASVAPERLGSFLATYYTVLNAAALVMQVFIAMRVLQRAGTIFALALLPMLLVVGGGAMAALGGTLTLVLLTKGADGALRHSLQRVSTELLFLPLSPEERSSSKPVFDSVLVRGTQGVTALGLLGLATLGLDHVRILGGTMAALGIGWAAVAFSLRGPYLDQFRRSLGRPGARPSIDLNQLTLDGVEVVLEALSSTEEARVNGAMGVLAQARRTGLIPALVLYHPSPAVLTRALELISSHDRKDWVPLAERLVSSESADVRLAAVRSLGRYGHLEHLDPIGFIDPSLRATAAFFRADKLSEPASHPVVAELCKPGAELDAQRALLRTIAEFGNDGWSNVILALERIDASQLVRALPSAMARARDARFLPLLLKRLAFREGRDEVRRALVSMGNVALDALATALHDSKTGEPVRLHVPRAISRFGTRKAVSLLLDVLDSELPGSVRYKALRGLGRMTEEHRLRVPRSRVLPLAEENCREYLRTALIADALETATRRGPAPARPSGELLVALLRDKQRQSVDRLMRLFQLLHPREDLRRVFFALSSDDRSAHAAAGELLEVITLGYDEDLRDLVRAIADPIPTAERTTRLTELLGLHLGDELAALRELLEDPDPALSALAAEYAGRAEIFEVAVEVERVLTQNPWLGPERPASIAPPTAHETTAPDGGTTT